MSVPVLHESEVEELDLPGRRFRWLVADGRIPSDHCSACVIRVSPGDRVRPAHSHPRSEEVIYILSGSGRVLVDGDEQRHTARFVRLCRIRGGEDRHTGGQAIGTKPGVTELCRRSSDGVE